MLAIHNSSAGFHPRWIAYCQERDISYKLVNCYANNLVEQLQDCTALMWHYAQQNPKDMLIARQILFALEHTRLQVFPDFNTAWHFDDKVAQKYLLERLKLPMVPSFAFYNKSEALDWVGNTSFPKVFKLRGGAGSSNVKLVKNRNQALRLVNKAFGSGFSNYDPWASLKERWYKYKKGKVTIWEPIKGLLRFFYKPEYTKVLGREYGYVYFQDFIPNNASDTRIIVIAHKAFALKRFVRDNDFRASGSGNFSYAREEFDERCVKIAFKATDIMKSQTAAYDFVFDENNNPLLVEVSYGFVNKVYDPCPGYWDQELNWHEETFNPYGWMVESIR